MRTGTPKRLAESPNSGSASSVAMWPTRATRPADLAAGTALCKACPSFKPFRQAGEGTQCLIFDLKLFDFGRLALGRLDPFNHLRHRHDHVGISLEPRLELDVIGREARHDRRIHRVRHGALAEQERPAGLRKALAPDRADPVDIGLRAGPDLEAR